MKITSKLLIFISLFFMAIVQQTYTMFDMNYNLACKQLGIPHHATVKQVQAAYKKQIDEFRSNGTDFSLTNEALATINKVFQLRAKAHRDGTYTKIIRENHRTGWFTLKQTIEEFNQDGHFNAMENVPAYDYKRIFGVIGLGLTSTGIASYMYRNELTSFFSARLMPLLGGWWKSKS